MKNNNLRIKSFKKSDLADLAEAGSSGGLALSFYLGLKPDINFRSEANSILVREAEKIRKNKEYSKVDKKRLLAMVKLTKREIDLSQLPSNARTLVFFAKENSKMMICHIPVYILSKIVIGADYYIHPLVKAIEEFSRYLAVAVERDKAEFYSIFWGEFEGGSEMLLSDVPKKIRTSSSDDWKGRREKRIERHIEDRLRRHFKAVALKIREYFDRNGFNYLIIGCHKEVKAKFQEFLDKKSAKNLIGFFSLSHHNCGLMKEKSMALIKNHEKAVEEKIVKDLLDSTGGKRWMAVAGIDSVLENFYLHKIKMLVIGKNSKRTGYVCGECHHVFLLPGACSACGGKTAKARDVNDEIIKDAIKNKIKIKQLFFNHKDFDRFGIGAFLKDY